MQNETLLQRLARLASEKLFREHNEKLLKGTLSYQEYSKLARRKKRYYRRLHGVPKDAPWKVVKAKKDKQKAKIRRKMVRDSRRANRG